MHTPYLRTQEAMLPFQPEDLGKTVICSPVKCYGLPGTDHTERAVAFVCV